MYHSSSLSSKIQTSTWNMESAANPQIQFTAHIQHSSQPRRPCYLSMQAIQ
jgi:hypothetical protein